MNTSKAHRSPVFLFYLLYFLSKISLYRISVCKYTNSISFQRICKRKFPVITIFLFGFKYLALRKKPLLIHDQFVLFFLRNAYTVIRTCYRCKVAYYQNIITSCRRFSHKAEDTSVAIVGIDPLKCRWIIICTVKCRIFAVDMQKITDILLQLLMIFLAKKIPVKLSGLTPLTQLLRNFVIDMLTL